MINENDMEYEDNEDSEVEEGCQTDSDIELDEICPLRDDSKVVYQGHSNAILCVELDESRGIVYTGGLDDKVIVWEMSTGRMITPLNGHGDTVTNISVHSNGIIVASGDIAGLVIIWKRVNNEEKWEKVHEVESATIVGLTWINDILYICDSVGTVQSWCINNLKESPAMYKYGQGCSCSKFCLILNNTWCAVLYGESCGEHEDCNNTSSLHLNHIGSERSVKVDLKPISSTDNTYNEDDPTDEGLGAAWANKASTQSHMIAIGDWGKIIFATITAQGYTTQYKLNTVLIKDGGLVDNVAFSMTTSFLAFSTKRGLVGVYDISKNTIRHVWKYSDTFPLELRTQDDVIEETRVSQLCFSPSKPVFYSAGLDGRLCEWDARVMPSKEVPTLWGYSGIVWDMKVTKNGSAIVLVSEDKVGRVFAL